ncbi:sel1 repeat family protein [Catenovulum agarivorans]|uniref:sel1 repeat family protein n=1 Tax=Catenovulum agarivorans TaxID=1172192 RepID=UPI0002DE9CB0|nr:sel1 repeat family protein [Catenovulum agarivorans]
MRHWLIFFQVCLFSLGLALIAGLFYFLWPNTQAKLKPELTSGTLQSPPTIITQVQTSQASNNSNIQIQSGSQQAHSEQNISTNTSDNKLNKIENYPHAEPLQSDIADIDLDAFKQQATIEQYLSYLLALEKCMPFHRYADKTGRINISPQRLEVTLNQHASRGVPEHISQSLINKINLCNGVKLDYVHRLYQEVTYVANQGNIQAMMILSHLPDMTLTDPNQVDEARRKDFYHKQMMWLEQARQQGSLNALFNLAVRHHHGVSPDPVSAASYYQVLQHFLPEYQYEDTVANLTDSMKTWQKAEVEQMTKLLIEEMDTLPQLYDW